DTKLFKYVKQVDYNEGLERLVTAIVAQTLDELNCLAVINDRAQQDIFNSQFFKTLGNVPYYKVLVEEKEDLQSPNFKTLSVIRHVKRSGCRVYILLISNGGKVSRFLKFGDRYRMLDTRAKFVLLHDKRLFHSNLHYLWKKIVNIVFLREHGRYNRPGAFNNKRIRPWYDISTVPFPTPIQKIFIPQRLDTWHLGKFHTGTDLFREKTSDLQGEQLKVVTFQHVPASVKMTAPARKDTIVEGRGPIGFGGLEIEVLTTLANALNFEPDVYEAPDADMEQWGRKQLNDSYTGLLGEVMNGNADVALGNLYYTPYYLELLDLTIPYTTECLTFLTPESLTDNSWKTLILPFKPVMWAAVVVTLFLAGFVFYALANYHHHIVSNPMHKNIIKVKEKGQATGETKMYVDEEVKTEGLYLFSELDNGILYTYGMLLLISLPKLPTGWSLRVLTGWWWIYCILVVVAYRASMTAILTNPTPRKLKWKHTHGLNIDGRKLTHLRFADDITLMARSAKMLEEMIIEVDKVSSAVGLTMNPTKTKVMTNGTQDPIQIQQSALEYVQQYVYLGQSISLNKNTENEIKRRIGLAWNKFWSLKFLLRDKRQKASTKAEILDKCVMPTLLYGCQTWSLTEKQKKQLQVCQRRMERKILNVSLRDRLRNEEIRRRTKMRDVVERAENLKWKWGGHVACMDHQKWTNRTTMWDPREGRQHVGRQKTRWADYFRTRAGSQWSRVARDREVWRQLAPNMNQQAPDRTERQRQSLGYGTTRFDGEIIAISESFRNLLYHINKFKNAVILSDSKAAILSIVSKHTPSSQTAEITKMLSQLISLNKRIVFQWIPCHCGILGNENADALAKKGSTATYRPITKSTVTIDTLEKLVDSHISCGGWGEEVKEFFLTSLDTAGQKIGLKFEVIYDTDSAVERVARGQFAYYENIYFLQYLRVKRQQTRKHNKTKSIPKSNVGQGERNLHIMHDCVIHMPISIGLQKNSPLKPHMDRFLRRIIEAGLVKKWLKDVMLNIVSNDDTQEEVDDDKKALMDLPKLYMAFVALGIGYLLSICALIAEQIHWQCIVKKDPLYDKYAINIYYDHKKSLKRIIKTMSRK
ncbi:hypothetical protein ANN_07706, partial [Periplaneta americana]